MVSCMVRTFATASLLMNSVIGSIADVLQEPLGRNLAAAPGCLRQLVNAPGDRKELRTLHVAALRIGDLMLGGSPRGAAGDEIGKPDHSVVCGRAAAAPALRRQVFP